MKKKKTQNWTLHNVSNQLDFHSNFTKAEGVETTIPDLVKSQTKTIIVKLDGEEVTTDRKKIINKVTDKLKLVSTFYTAKGMKTHSTEIGFDIVQ